MRYFEWRLAAALLVALCGLSCGDVETSFEFFMHDNVLVPNASAIIVAGPNGSNTNALAFGTVLVIDDALTRGSSPTSAPMGRGQGSYFVSSLDGFTILLTFTAVFSDRNGTLSFHGADKITDPSREIAIVGGTGIYRSARGVAVITTVSNVGASVVLHFNVTFQHSDEIKSSSSPESSSSSPGSSSSSPSSSAATFHPKNCFSFLVVYSVAAAAHRLLAA